MLFSTESVTQALESLPKRSVTTYVLEALDFIVPGEWENITTLEGLVADELGPGVSSGAVGAAVRRKFAETRRYQNALWLYNAVDTADRLLAAAALANKVGSRFKMLGFLQRFSPKSDVAQSIDLGIKVAVEAICYGLLNGLPRDSAAEFGRALQNYGKDSLMRLVALVALDGVLPLGPDFVRKASQQLGALDTDLLTQHPIYQKVSDLIPGDSAGEHLAFITNSFDSAGDWMNSVVNRNNLTGEGLVKRLRKVIELSDESLDYVSIALDATTSYFAHTGVQTVARQLIQVAAPEAEDEWQGERAMGRSSGRGEKQGVAALRPESGAGEKGGKGQAAGGKGEKPRGGKSKSAEWQPPGWARGGEWRSLKQKQKQEMAAFRREQQRQQEELRRQHEAEREAAERLRLESQAGEGGERPAPAGGKGMGKGKLRTAG